MARRVGGGCARLAVAAALGLCGAARGQGIGRPDVVWASAGHSGGENSIAVSPDGTTLATSGFEDGTIKLWRMNDGVFLRSMGGAITQMERVLFTPDGRHLVGASDWLPGEGDEEFKLWRTSDGALVRNFGGNGASGTITTGAMAVSPDGLWLATGYNYTHMRLWRIGDGGLQRTLDGVGGPIRYTPDGSAVITHAPSSGFPAGGVQVWRTSNWTMLRGFDASAPQGLSFTAAALSPDGQTLATGYNNTAESVKLWRLSDGQLLRTMTSVDANSVMCVAFSLDGASLAAAGEEDHLFPYLHRMFIFRTADGVVTRTIGSNYGATFTIAYAPDGAGIVTAGADDQIHLFATGDGGLVRNFGIRRGSVGSVAFSADSSLFAAGGDANETFDGADVELFRAADGARLRVCHGHTDVINSVAFAGAGDVMASGAGAPPPDTRDPTVRLWRVSDGGQLWVAPGHNGGTTSVAFARDGQVVVSGGRDGLVRVWDRADGAQLTSLVGHNDWVQCVAVSPDGTLLASGGDTSVRLWRTDDWSFVARIDNDDWPVNTVAFSPDGLTIAIGADRYGDNLKIVRVADGTLVRRFAGDPYDFMGQVKFTPDGRYILSSSRGYPPRIWMWSVADGSVARFFEQEVGWRYNPKLAVSPDGRMIGIGRPDATVVVARNPFGPTLCAADWDGSGALNLQDFLAFLSDFAAARADFNHSGATDVQDFLDFLQGFAAGC